MPIADSGERPPFFEGFASHAEYRAALARLVRFLDDLARAPARDPRLLLFEGFPSQRALRHAARRLEVELQLQLRDVGRPSARAWSHELTAGERN